MDPQDQDRRGPGEQERIELGSVTAIISQNHRMVISFGTQVCWLLLKVC